MFLVAPVLFMEHARAGEPRLNKELSPAIPVVGTYGDLLGQPVIDLGAGVRIRLGIEALTIPAGGGTLLYCLTEGYAPRHRGDSQYALGPVEVHGLPRKNSFILVV
jgi:hypothetical protein